MLATPCDICGEVIEPAAPHCPHERGCGRDGCMCDDSAVCLLCCHECNPLRVGVA